MKHTIKLYEKLSFGTHPCLDEQNYDGWLLRFANGYTKRANSVTMLEESTISLKEKITYCEKMYLKKGLPAIFKITPLSIEVDNVLRQMGYNAVDKTNVMKVNLDNILPLEEYEKEFQSKIKSAIISVKIDEMITKDWQNVYFLKNQVSEKFIPTAKKMHDKIVNQVLCTQVYYDEKVAACGLGVLEQGFVGLLDIVVSKEYRGLGFGKLLCQTLLARGKEKEAAIGYLQVVDSNTVAKNLYDGLGFIKQYSYWYRMKM